MSTGKKSWVISEKKVGDFFFSVTMFARQRFSHGNKMDLQTTLLWLPGALFSLTFHEFAHAWAAFKLGDPTAKREGRLTLNPLAHLDLFGTLAIIFAHIGWAKPVPINPYFFRNPRRGIVLTSIAGPASNLLLALVFGTCVRVLMIFGMHSNTLWFILLYAMHINIVLAVFNLIPLPPLDGSKVLFGLTHINPHVVERLEQVGPMILFGLIFFGMLSGINVFGIIIFPFVTLFNIIFVGV